MSQRQEQIVADERGEFAGPESVPISPVISRDLHPYQLFMLALGLYVLAALGLQTFLELDESTHRILNVVDDCVCLVFFLDFWGNLYFARSKWEYLKWGWLDLLSSLPTLDIARASRLARVIRVLRALRSIRLIRLLADQIIHRRTDGAFFAIVLLSITLVLFSSIAVLQFETAKESNIRTPEDALWWAFATITTVGYGDKYPVTTEGRVLAAVIMVAGVGMFGSFTGLVASWLLSPTRKDLEQDSELAQIKVRLEELHGVLSQDPRLTYDADLNRLIAAWSSLPPELKSECLAVADRHQSASPQTPGTRSAAERLAA